jgi:hypothetical protein
MVVDFNKKFLNTDKFRQPAIHFQKYGYYINAPRGTTSYREYWDRESDRCLYGFTAEDGDYISGYNYFYLNYFIILLVKEIEYTRQGKRIKKAVKDMDFPRFYDYDAFFFQAVEEAERQGKHLIALKARRKGYSFKIASMLCRNFYLIPNAKNLALAAEAEFLTKEGILTKAWDALDFIDEHTAWAKRRQKVDTKMHKRASFTTQLNGVEVEMGYKSEIMGITLKNDANKSRGKSARLIIFEEAGKFPNLKTAWQVARPSVEQGSNVHGTMIAFGTGGSPDSDFEGLSNLFNEPDAYNCLAFDNIWDPDAAIDNKCGFFVPAYSNMDGSYEGQPFMDKDGNTNVEVAKKFLLSERKKVIEGASDRNAIDRHIAEHCIIPIEATLNISSNIFPKQELIKHLAYIKNTKAVKEFKQVGDLYFDGSGKVVWEQSKHPRDITKYRLGPGDDARGQIVIWEHPVENPPYGLYIAGNDPYDQDQSTSGSLGATFIYKRFQNFESYYDLPVAEYTGRPETAEEYYENVRKLLIYYRATLLYENEKKGLFIHFTNKHAEYLLADQPEIISDIIKDSKVQRKKGIHMNQAIKQYMEIEIRDWLNEEYAPGKKNLTKIYSEPLLEELISYNPDGNFDRVIAFGLTLLYRKETYNLHVKKAKEDNKRALLFDGIVDFNKGTNLF